MRYAIISNGIVVNVIVADEDFIANHLLDGQIGVNVDEIHCGPGWTYDGETFAEPEPEADPEP